MKPQLTLWVSALLLGAAHLGWSAHATSITAAPIPLAQSSAAPEKTYMTPQSANAIAVQIQDGEFFFYDILHRSYGNYFTVTQRGVQVSYNRDTGNVLVINSVTGTEFYNYAFSEAAAGSGTYPTGSSTAPSIPVTTMTPLNNDQFEARITEGEFVFDGVLTRTSGNTFIGSDRQVRVIYDLANGRIVVINVVTGTEFYNYPYQGPSEGTL